MPVTELRLVVTADDYEAALAFYRDVLGLPVAANYDTEHGRSTLLDAGRARLELFDARQAAYIDEVEVGRRITGHIRLAFEVEDTVAMTESCAAGGAVVIAGPTRTPWGSLNARLDGPANCQLTLFSEEPTT
jgi:lactoylglutathione lyase